MPDLSAVEQEPAPLSRMGTWSGPAGEPLTELAYAVVDYFGEDIRVVTDPLSLEQTMEEFLDLAASMESDDVRAMGAVRGFLRALIHPADFNTFWRLVKEKRQDIDAQMGFGKWIVEELTGHPFVPQSDSSDGLSSVDPSSADGSSLRVQHRLEEAGRPDLAVGVLLRREQLEAQPA